jgi:2',3'-cyclic-nucleotide 2'-phosphodiesterase (5'-nucleotidase family)
MSRSGCAIAAAVVAASAALYGFLVEVERGERLARIVILHTNDIHGQALPFGQGPDARGGLAALAATIGRARLDAQRAGEDCVLVDAGDLWVGPPEGTRTEGRFIVSVLNSFGYVAGAIGNHEFDHGTELAARNARLSSFPILAANVHESSTARLPDWLRADVHRTVAGVDVRFLGLTTSRMREVTVLAATAGLDFEDEETTVARELARDAAPLTVLVTHCGDDVDRRLANRFHGRIAAIVGGHSHREIDPAWHVPEGASDSVLIAQTGAKTRNLGVIHLVFDRQQRRVVSSEGRLVPVLPSRGEDARVRALVDEEVAEVNKALGVRLCELVAPLDGARGPRSSQLGNFVCDVLRRATGSDAAFTNKAGLRANLAPGAVLLRHLYEVDPFGNTVVTMTLTGAQLLELLDRMCESRAGVLEVSGLVVRFDETAARGKRVESVLLGGKALDPLRSYRIATNNFLAAGGDGHLVFRDGTDRRDEGVPVRDLLRRALETAGRLDPGPLDERLVSSARR